MKAIILTILLVATIVAADGERERRPRYPNRRPSRPQEKEDHFDEEDLDTPLSERPSRFTKDGYLINYNLHCSTRSCFCSNICQPWAPCDCMCPPPCPPTTTTTTTTEPEIICTNGAPSWTYPECCFNGGHGEFCCRNGAQNLHCCTNGANNPWCSLPTEAPVQGTTPPSSAPPGNDCNQCQCQPCIPWVPCQPCPCQQTCGK